MSQKKEKPKRRFKLSLPFTSWLSPQKNVIVNEKDEVEEGKAQKLPWPIWLLKTIWRYIFSSKKGQMSLGEQFVMYSGILLGVMFSEKVRGSGSEITFLTAAIAALVITPYTFEKLGINPNSPFLVRFSLCVQQGVFWDALFSVIGKSLSS